MNDLTTTQGIVALAAAAVAVVALLFAIVLAVKLRRLRASQRVVLGAQGQRDLVAHAERLETGFVDLRDWVEEVLQGLDRILRTPMTVRNWRTVTALLDMAGGRA